VLQRPKGVIPPKNDSLGCQFHLPQLLPVRIYPQLALPRPRPCPRRVELGSGHICSNFIHASILKGLCFLSIILVSTQRKHLLYCRMIAMPKYGIQQIESSLTYFFAYFLMCEKIRTVVEWGKETDHSSPISVSIRFLLSCLWCLSVLLWWVYTDTYTDIRHTSRPSTRIIESCLIDRALSTSFNVLRCVCVCVVKFEYSMNLCRR
jgi:hypothetical protein